MQIVNFLGSDQIILSKNNVDRESLFETLIRKVFTEKFKLMNPGVTYQQLRDAIDTRQEISSTYIGEGIALPHARIKGLKSVGMSMAIAIDSVQYDEENKADIICMVLTPEEKPTFSLNIMSALIKFISAGDNRDCLFSCKDSEQIYKFLENCDIKIKELVTAKDIMRAPGLSVTQDMPLKTVTRLMADERLDVLPVVNEKNEVVGEVTSDRIFRFGLPDFFSTLHSISFIAEFDPFEKYFKEESKTLAGDLKLVPFTTVSPSCTIFEIVFELSVKKCRQIYVVDEDGRWIGYIDRSVVLNSVINF